MRCPGRHSRGDASVGPSQGPDTDIPRGQPKCLKCVALCATQDVGPTELRPVPGVHRRIDRNSSSLHRSNPCCWSVKASGRNPGTRSAAATTKSRPRHGGSDFDSFATSRVVCVGHWQLAKDFWYTWRSSLICIKNFPRPMANFQTLGENRERGQNRNDLLRP